MRSMWPCCQSVPPPVRFDNKWDLIDGGAATLRVVIRRMDQDKEDDSALVQESRKAGSSPTMKMYSNYPGNALNKWLQL